MLYSKEQMKKFNLTLDIKKQISKNMKDEKKEFTIIVCGQPVIVVVKDGKPILPSGQKVPIPSKYII